MSKQKKFDPAWLQTFATQSDSISTQKQMLQPESGYYNLPTSQFTHLIAETMSAGKNVAGLPDRKRQVSRTTKYEVFENGSSRQVKVSNKNEAITLELPDIDKFSAINKTAKKIFTLVLIKANEQAIHGGALTKDSISFPLQELVDLGMYKNMDTARKGFRDGVSALSDIKIGGTMNIGKRNQKDVIGMHPFRYGEIERGQCYVYLEPNYNWASITQYFTVIPRYYFALSNRASDLLYYICYLARQNMDKLSEHGYFTISMKAIQHKLQLPNENGCKEPAKLIRQPIEESVKEIVIKQKETLEENGIAMELVYDKRLSITDFLQSGYLKVTLSGSLVQHFLTINQKKEALTEAAAQRRQRIAESAAAIRMAKGGGNEKN